MSEILWAKWEFYSWRVLGAMHYNFEPFEDWEEWRNCDR